VARALAQADNEKRMAKVIQGLAELQRRWHPDVISYEGALIALRLRDPKLYFCRSLYIKEVRRLMSYAEAMHLVLL
jgi:hypothetical protein